MPADDPRSAIHMHCERGNTHAQRGDLPAALADYERALELDAKLLQAHYGRAIALFGLRRYDEARAALDKAKDVLPEDLYSAVRRGMDAWQTVETEVAGMIERFQQDKRIKAVLIFGKAAQLWHTPDRFLSGGVRDIDMVVIVDGFETRREAVLTVAKLQGSTQTPMDIQVRDLAIWRTQKKKDLFVKQEVLPKMKVLYGEP